MLMRGMTKREFLDAHTRTHLVRFTPWSSTTSCSAAANHLFTRDTSAWIYDGVAINAMRWRPGSREYRALRGDLLSGTILLSARALHVWSQGHPRGD
ncbi:hypothetical protein GCM10023238_07040 [Streptomyces heliomycini]